MNDLPPNAGCSPTTWLVQRTTSHRFPFRIVMRAIVVVESQYADFLDDRRLERKWPASYGQVPASQLQADGRTRCNYSVY